MTGSKRKIPLPLAMMMCIITALTVWGAASLLTADAASASVDDLYVGTIKIYNEGQYQNPTKLPAGVTYDKDNNELTLQNASIDFGDTDDGDFCGGILYSGTDDLTVIIKGKVTIRGGESFVYVCERKDPNVIANITIKGDGQSSSKLVQEIYEGEERPLFISNQYEPEYGLTPATKSNLKIEGLTIESYGGFNTDYTNVNITGCNWTMDGGIYPIYMMNHDSTGILSVKNSYILMRAYKKTSDSPYAFYCGRLDLNGLGLYAGDSTSRFRAKLTPSGVFKNNSYKAYQISQTAPQLWYKLTFNGNKGKAKASTMWVKANQAISASGTMPKATRAHYKFTGWYTAASGGTKITSASKADKSKTLYAHWKVTGKKKKVRLVTSMKSSFGGSFRITYYKNGMVKKIKNSMDIWTFTYDDDMRYATVAHYQPHFKKAKKPLYKITFNYSTKKAKYASNYFGDSWSAPFKVNKAGQLTYFNNSGIGERYTFSYNKKGYLIKEVMKRGSRIRLNVTYKRNSKGLIRSVSHNDKDLEGLVKAKYSYSMKNGVPKRSTAKVQSYTDKVSFKYKTKTVRDWQKKIIMDQQRMLYSMDHNWGAALLSI